MSLHQDIKSQMVEAMKAKDQVRLSVIRGLLAAFTNEAVAKKRRPDGMLSDEEALNVISRAVKQRKDSIEQFKNGARQDLADAEMAELKVLQAYLPAQMSKEEIFEYVKSRSAGVEKEKANQFMGTIMKELKSRADGMIVKEAIDSLLG